MLMPWVQKPCLLCSLLYFPGLAQCLGHRRPPVKAWCMSESMNQWMSFACFSEDKRGVWHKYSLVKGHIRYTVGWDSEHLEESGRASWKREHSCWALKWRRRKGGFSGGNKRWKLSVYKLWPKMSQTPPLQRGPHRPHIEQTPSSLAGGSGWSIFFCPALAQMVSLHWPKMPTHPLAPASSPLISWRWTPQSSPVRRCTNHSLVGQRLAIPCNNLA